MKNCTRSLDYGLRPRAIQETKYGLLVYTTQVNSAFGASKLASSKVIRNNVLKLINNS